MEAHSWFTGPGDSGRWLKSRVGWDGQSEGTQGAVKDAKGYGGRLFT